MPPAHLQYRKRDYARAGILGTVVVAIFASLGVGLAIGGPKTHTAAKVAPPSTVAPTTVPVGTTPSSTTTTVPAMRPTTHPIHVPGGTFVVVGGEVKLKHVVARGETLTAIAAWFDQTLGYQVTYALNKSIIGNNPDLIFPGEILTVEVPISVIPHISPVYLADASAG